MNEIDLKEIAKHLARYATCKPKLAIDRLMKVELIRNNYTKATLYNLIVGTRRLKKDGHITRGMPKELAGYIQEIFNAEPMGEQPITQPKELTLEEQLAKLENNYNIQKDIYEKQIEEYNNSIKTMEDKTSEIKNLLDILNGVYYEQRRTLSYEYMKNKIIK